MSSNQRSPTSELKYEVEPKNVRFGFSDPGNLQELLTSQNEAENSRFEDPEEDSNVLPPTMDLSLLLEKHHFGKFSRGRSAPSKSMFSISIPDPKNAEAEFVYNYFLPDERLAINTDPQAVRYDSRNYNPADIAYLAAKEQKARFVKIKFDKPNLNLSDFTSVNNANNSVSSPDPEGLIFGNFDEISEIANAELTFQDIVKKVVVEGAASNANYTGFELIDTFADQKIYDYLQDLMTQVVINNPAQSPREKAQEFLEKISENENNVPNPTGLQKTELVNILSQLQPAGISLAANDVVESDVLLAQDNITKQAFGVKLNNLFMGDIVSAAALSPNTIFEDEYRALESHARAVQDTLVATRDPDLVYEMDYQMRVEPLSTRDINISADQLEAVNLAFEDLIKQVLDTNESGIVSANELLTYAASVENMGYDSEQSRKVALALMNALNPVDFYLQEEKVPNLKVCGYVISKTEILANGRGTKTFPNIFIDNPKYFSEFIDEEVRYGAAYTYKVRTLAIVDAVVKVVNRSNNAKKYQIAKILIASEGKSLSVECVENVPPPPPVRVRPRIDRRYRCVEILWDFPFNKQRDIKRFQVFKRATINEPFVLMAEYDFDDSVEKVVPLETAQSDKLHKIPSGQDGNIMPKREYLDTDFKIAVNEFDATFSSNSAIYAVASVDAHGLSSGYSAQIQVSYDRLTNRLITNVISQRSAPKPYPNLYLNSDFFEDVITSSAKTRCTVFFDPEYGQILKKIGTNPQGEVEKVKLDYLKTSDVDYNYTIQFINIDLQKEKRIPIRIVNASGNTINIPIANISPTNLSFEFGV